MYDDLIKKLRHCGNAISCLHCPYWEGCGGSKEDLTQAANAIEELAMKLHGDEAAIAGMKREIERMVIDTANSKPRWIPVTERLPEEDGRYLVLYPLKTKPSVWWHKVYGFAKDLVEVDEYEFNEHKSGFYGYDGEYGYYEDKDVTHWMPLPSTEGLNET